MGHGVFKRTRQMIICGTWVAGSSFLDNGKKKTQYFSSIMKLRQYIRTRVRAAIDNMGHIPSSGPCQEELHS